jgi:hypothetical protein
MVLTLERAGLFDDSPESLAASKCWLLPSCSQSYVDPISQGGANGGDPAEIIQHSVVMDHAV